MRSSRLQGSYAKLDYQQSNLFVISTQINEVTLFLDLPQDIRLHLIVYNSLMETRNTSNLPNRVGCHPIFDPTCWWTCTQYPIQLVEGPKYKVAIVVEFKIMHNKVYYLLDCWDVDKSPNLGPTKNLTNVQALLKEFHCHYPNKLGHSSTVPHTRSRKGI